MPKKYLWWALWGALSVALLAFIALLLCPVYVDVCEPAKDGAAQKCEPYDILYFAGLQLGKILLHAEAWTALGTLAIAAFTWTLKRSTDRLWAATLTADEARKDETKILQRAYISVEPAGIHDMLDMRAVLGHVAIKNAGNLPATALSWSIKIKDSSLGDDADFPLDAGKGSIVVSPRSESVRGSDEFVGFDDLNEKCGSKDGRGRGDENPVYIYVWGVVRYHDGFAAGRETRFCHRYNWINRGRVPGKHPSSGDYQIAAAFARVHEHGNGAT